MIDCKIYYYPKNNESEWMVIETDQFAILQIRENNLFEIPKNIKKTFLQKTEDGYDLVYKDKHGYKVTYQAIDRKVIKFFDFINFIQYITSCKNYI